ncbi:MAG: hypothetical protein JRI90_14605 [Deltaproteobacteria bacterium]|nr:hypothetical protein [Deltaproteobacteria bacterium]
MAYTPQLSPYHSGTLKRISWALGNVDTFIDPGKVCEKCKDRSRCENCYFNSGRRLNEAVPVDPIRHELSTEVEMKVNQVSVLVSKKVGRNFCSWSLSYGATAEVEDEHFTDVISQLDNQLKEMVSESLPTPNGNGNGMNNHQQLTA